MMRSTIAALVIATGCASAGEAAPMLQVSDSYAANVWAPPTACVAGTAVVPSPGCAPSITTIVTPPTGYRINRTNTAPGGQAFTRALALDNGVLAAGVEASGVESVVARARFVETYRYIGTANAPFLVPFTIDRFSLATNSGGVGLLQTARMLINIDVTTNSITTTVATLDYQAQSDSVTAFTLTPAPSPLSGVTLTPGFLAFAGVTIPNVSTAINGPGGIMTVDLGTFAVGQAFTLDYRMSCRTSGTGPGGAFCNVGDPFAIPTGPGFDLFGQATPVPEVATWLMMIVGFGSVGATLRARRAALA